MLFPTGWTRQLRLLAALGLPAALGWAAVPAAKAGVAKLELPAAVKAKGHGPVLLGSAPTAGGDRIEAFAFVHRVEEPPAKEKGAPAAARADGACFEIPAQGVRFVNPTSYVLDATNDDGLSEGQVARALAEAFDAWNRQLDAALFGGESQSRADGPDFERPDGLNELSFADLGDDSILSVSVMWAKLSGPPETLGIFEWDIVLNDPPFTWGDVGPTREHEDARSEVMDLLSVLTHEAGHILGLGHPGPGCDEETMSPAFHAGESRKRTLGNGDFTGLMALYGTPAEVLPDETDEPDPDAPAE